MKHKGEKERDSEGRIVKKRPIWFKRKSYGYGWTPSTWQGWAITMLFIVLLLVHSYTFALTQYSIVGFLFVNTFLVSIVIWFCYMYGEEPKWQWGGKKDEKSD